MRSIKSRNRVLTQWKTIVGVLFFIGIGSFFLYYGITNVLEDYNLMVNGKIIPGYIIETEEEAEDTDRGTHWYHTVIYTYQLPDGREFEAIHEGDGRLKEEFRYLSEPYPVDVTYLPDNPTVSRLTEDVPDSIIGVVRKQALSWILSPIFFIIGFWVLWWLVRELKHPPENTQDI